MRQNILRAAAGAVANMPQQYGMRDTDAQQLGDYSVGPFLRGIAYLFISPTAADAQHVAVDGVAPTAINEPALEQRPGGRIVPARYHLVDCCHLTLPQSHTPMHSTPKTAFRTRPTTTINTIGTTLTAVGITRLRSVNTIAATSSTVFGGSFFQSLISGSPHAPAWRSAY